jgi:Collagen triple helix repeat (20 copies)
VAADSNPNGGAISANGCRAAFSTEANSLVEPEPDGEREIYVRQLSPCNEEPEVTPTSLDFGAQALDTIGAAHTITVTAGSEALQIQKVLTGEDDSSDFVVTDDECTGETLQPEEKCSFVVRFAPSAAGVRSASVILRTAPTTDLEVSLAGAGGQLPSGETGTPGEPGGEGPEGAAGQPGLAGAAGVSGSAGAHGVDGARGARGPAGRDASVRCRLAKGHHKVTCTVAFAGKRATRTAPARLTKNGLTYARGSLAALRTARAIQPGAYTLRLIWAGRVLEIPVRLR